MEFTSLSGSTDFIIERDFRLKWIKEKRLWNSIASKVLNKKGMPCSDRTIRRTFLTKNYDLFTPTQISIWLVSKAIISEIISESNTYATNNKATNNEG